MKRDLRMMLRDPSENACFIAAAIVGSAVVGAGASVYGASKQAKAAGKAADTQLHMYETTRGDLMPYNLGGQQDFTAMNRLLTGPSSQITAEMRALPGYQFAEQQGLRSIQSSASARGLGLSGAAMRDAARYATGLADQTYGNQVNRLLAGAQLGETAGAQTGAQGTQAAANAGQAYMAQGNAYAGGAAGVANSISNGLLGYGMYGPFGGGAGAGNFAGNGSVPSIVNYAGQY